jgi:hypothetical protein
MQARRIQSTGALSAIPSTDCLAGGTTGTVGVTDVGAGEVLGRVGVTAEAGVGVGSTTGVLVGTGPTPRTFEGTMAVILEAGVGSTDSHPESGPPKTSGQV